MGQTDKWALPYPEADTLISVSAPIVQDLAEKIDTALSQVINGNLGKPGPAPWPGYTVPGTLLQDFTTSGTFTVPPGVTTIHVMVLGGGQNGGTGNWPGSQPAKAGNGGNGGEMVVVFDIPVLPDDVIPVTIGAGNTNSVFGTVTAKSGAGYTYTRFGSTGGKGGTGQWYNTSTSALVQGAMPHAEHGIACNGVTYAGGGGAGKGTAGNGDYAGAGRDGGGNGGQNSTAGGNGSTGTGAGGGGGAATSQATAKLGGLGGSGRVMVFSEQITRDTPPAAIDPVVMAALNNGVMVGAYAVDPVAPVDTLGTLVPYPDEPQPTGEEWTDEETGETHPVLAWPCAGWTYNDGEWSPPDD